MRSPTSTLSRRSTTRRGRTSEPSAATTTESTSFSSTKRGRSPRTPIVSMPATRRWLSTASRATLPTISTCDSPDSKPRMTLAASPSAPTTRTRSTKLKDPYRLKENNRERNLTSPMPATAISPANTIELSGIGPCTPPASRVTNTPARSRMLATTEAPTTLFASEMLAYCQTWP